MLKTGGAEPPSFQSGGGGGGGQLPPCPPLLLPLCNQICSHLPAEFVVQFCSSE